MNPVQSRFTVLTLILSMLAMTLFSPAGIFPQKQQAHAATDTATIYYKKGFATPFIHFQKADRSWTLIPGLPLNDSEVAGYAKITIPLGGQPSLTAAFNDGLGHWDSRNMMNYTFPPGISTFDAGTITAGVPSGAITPSPAPTFSALPTATPVPTGTPVMTPLVTSTPTPLVTPLVTSTPTAAPTPGPSTFPQPHPSVKIYYQSAQTAYIHYKINNGVWTAEPGIKLSASGITNYLTAEIFGLDIDNPFQLTAAFNNGKGAWDNNKGKDYVLMTGIYTISNGIVTSGTPAPTATPQPTATAVPTAVPPIHSSASVTFTIDKCFTQFGQSCWIVGDFSKWSTNGGIKLNTGTTDAPYPKWTGSKTFPLNQSLSFKIVVAPDQGGQVNKWESGNNRSLTVNSNKIYSSVWGSPDANVVSPATPTPIVTSTPLVTATPTATPVVTSTPTPLVTSGPTATPDSQTVTVYYKSAKPMLMHYKLNNGNWTKEPGQAMSASPFYGYQKIEYAGVAPYTITAAFTDGTLWDNQAGKNYVFPSGGVYTVENGSVRNGEPFKGGNTITIFYPYFEPLTPRGFQIIHAHFRPEGGSWTNAPGVPFTDVTPEKNYIKADLRIGTAAKIAELAVNVKTYAGEQWENNGGSNFRDLTPGTYTFYKGFLVKAAPSELPAAPMAFESAVRGVGHGCYEYCAYLSGTVRAVPLGSTQKVIVSYQIPDGSWRETEAMKMQTVSSVRQIWRFSTSGTFGESPKRFKVTYIADGRTVHVDDNGMALYPGDSAFVLGEKEIERDCGSGFGSFCGYTSQSEYVGGVIAKKSYDGSSPSVQVVYQTAGGQPQTMDAISNGLSSYNGTIHEAYEAFRFAIPLTGNTVHTYYLKTTVNGITSIDNNNGLNYSTASPY